MFKIALLIIAAIISPFTMEILKSTGELRNRLREIREIGNTIGFVPTMGSLHDGHLSLIEIARKNSDVVVCSIYVNPTQFNDPKDFELYPNNLTNDLQLLDKTGCDIVFTPESRDIYPEGIKKADYQIGELGTVMEGKYRPGHFNGVIQVVKRLFDLVAPDVAVFGEKDFQQLAVIRWLVDYFNLDIKIIGAPIVREPDGLAMSSRNVRLSETERKTAKKLSEMLFYVKDNFDKKPVLELKEEVLTRLGKIKDIELEYFEMADIATLQSISAFDPNRSTGVFIAAKIGPVRLIDNIVLF